MIHTVSSCVTINVSFPFFSIYAYERPDRCFSDRKRRVRVWTIFSKISNICSLYYAYLKEIYYIIYRLHAGQQLLCMEAGPGGCWCIVCVYSKVHDAVDYVAEKSNEACWEPAAVRCWRADVSRTRHQLVPPAVFHSFGNSVLNVLRPQLP